MKNDELFELLGELDGDAVKAAEEPPIKKAPRPLLRYGIAAAVLCLAVGAGAVVFVLSDHLRSDGNSSQTTETAAKDIPEKVVHVQSDIIVYSDLNSLLDASDLIVIGEFSADAEQEIEYQYNPEFGKDVIVDGESVNTLHISKVLKGAPASEEIKIVQSYFVQDEPEQLVSFSGLTPMVRGEEWLFFLRYDKEKDNYWCAGDYCGRYPVPNDEIKAKLDEIGEQGLLDKKTLGIYDDSANNTYLYRDIIEYFGDRLTD